MLLLATILNVLMAPADEPAGGGGASTSVAGEGSTTTAPQREPANTPSSTAPSTPPKGPSTSASESDGLAAENKDLKAKIAKLEAEERKRGEDKLKAEGKTQELLAAKEKEAADLKAQLEARDLAERQTQLKSKVLDGLPADKAKLANAAYLAAAGEHKWDPDPADHERAAKSRRELLEKEYPDLFKGGARPSHTGGGGVRPGYANKHSEERSPYLFGNFPGNRV